MSNFKGVVGSGRISTEPTAATAKMVSPANNRSAAAVIVRRESFPPIMDGSDGHGKSVANNRAIVSSDNNNGAMGQHKVGVLVEKNVAFKQQRSTSEEVEGCSILWSLTSTN